MQDYQSVFVVVEVFECVFEDATHFVFFRIHFRVCLGFFAIFDEIESDFKTIN